MVRCIKLIIFQRFFCFLKSDTNIPLHILFHFRLDKYNRIYSLPFALTFTKLYDPIQIMLEVFFITYGFIGIEQVSMALDDPFGEYFKLFKDVILI